MTIDEIQIVVVKPHKGLVGFASCVIDGWLYISGLGVYERLNGGYRITYPTRKIGSYQIRYFHPINQQSGLAIEQAISAACHEFFKK